MDFIQAIVLGIIQGITEWIPVSSSAHFAIFNRMVQANATISFYTLLQVGSIISILFFYRTRIYKYLGYSDDHSLKAKNLLLVLIASIPVAIVGIILYSELVKYFGNLFYNGIGLIITAFIVIISHFGKGEGKPNYWKAIVVGAAQTLSLIPGISRTSLSISTSSLLKISKEEAFDFGIFLSLPVLIGMVAMSYIKFGMQFDKIGLIGIASSAIAGFIALHMLRNTVRNGQFSKYWMYCLIVGIILLFN